MILFSVNWLFSKEITASAGQIYENEATVFAFTLGEPIVETINNSSIQLTQGFQQSLPNLILSYVNDLNQKEPFEFSASPNPTTNYLTIQYTINSSNKFVRLFLTNMNGQLLFNKKGMAKAGTFKETISTLLLTDGLYHLSLQKGLVTKSIPIIINH